MSSRSRVHIFSDGSCRPNPGPGGWGAILRHVDSERELSGAEPDTTNNRMEMIAVIRALEELEPGCEITITTDSQYLQNGFKQGWLARWKRNGWRTAAGKPVKNDDLWRTLDELTGRHQVRWQWVRGHTGHPENERCDQLANAARERLERGA